MYSQIACYRPPWWRIRLLERLRRLSTEFREMVRYFLDALDAATTPVDAYSEQRFLYAVVNNCGTAGHTGPLFALIHVNQQNASN